MVTVIGLTGGMGSGKSTAARILGELGAEVIDADRVGHRIYAPDTPAWREIVAAFGPEILAADRTVDRRKLGARVFAEPEALQTLNRITHGKIYAYIQGQLDYIRAKQAARVVVVEAAVLLEAGWRSLVDQLWVIAADEAVALARLKAYKGMTEEQARARLAAQLSNEARIAQADRVIWNNADLEALRRAIEEAWHSLERA
ncbi:MAG: dephospho-CoA kinase [Candidatus Tectimicrobiota bacterium]|nr:MAG: dephospho-CoA kinase [Candidatus Tectomicrobia bacterium]